MPAVKLSLADAAATTALGAALAQALGGAAGAIVYLQGDLGTGKTTLARGLLRALGVGGSIRSPTYTLMEPYRIGEREVLHLDLYRLSQPKELHNLGLDDYPPERTLWLVEWPERGSGILPPADLSIQLSREGEGRTAQLAGASALGAQLERAWRIATGK